MKTAAVIAEYNPFHKGHAWQLSQLRQRGASHIAVVMSPDFTQRGTPAILPKRVRAAAALQGGADLVLELPVCYACAGAQGFAFGAVQLIGAMGCVDWLGFGAEDADLALLEQAANALEHPQVQLALKEELAAGITFAKARERAVRRVFGERVSQILQQPNNILAVEYLAQLRGLSPERRPQAVPLERVGNTHDGAPVQGFASASYLRGLLLAGEWEQAAEYLPDFALHLYRQAAKEGKLARMENGERAVLSALRRMSREELAALPDLSEGIENRLYAAAQKACSLEELYEQIKTKRYPLSRVRRLVLAAFLQLALKRLPIRKAVGNLLSNASLYSPEGAEIRVWCGMQEGSPVLTVENTVAHISEEALPHLFEAFYREEGSRNRATGGSGLGLYLVKMILDRHGAECAIENTADGVRATVRFSD